MSDYLKEYVQYIINTGMANAGLLQSQFDEDWEPIGPQLRRDLLKQRWTAESRGKVFVTLAGYEALQPKASK
jgi:hypothetical protein